MLYNCYRFDMSTSFICRVITRMPCCTVCPCQHITACSISLTIWQLQAFQISGHVCTPFALKISFRPQSQALCFADYRSAHSSCCIQIDMRHVHAGPSPLPNLYNVYHTSKQVTCKWYKTMKVSKSQVTLTLAAKTETTSHTFVYSVCG